MAYKATLPKELQTAMKLSDEEFEVLCVNMLELVRKHRPVLELIPPSTTCPGEVAWRPSEVSTKFFAIKFDIAIDNDGEDCFEVTGFKPMTRTEYMAYCSKEYGEVPADLLAQN